MPIPPPLCPKPLSMPHTPPPKPRPCPILPGAPQGGVSGAPRGGWGLSGAPPEGGGGCLVLRRGSAGGGGCLVLRIVMPRTHAVVVVADWTALQSGIGGWHFHHCGLELLHNHTYHYEVKCHDILNHTAFRTSEGTSIDITPPECEQPLVQLPGMPRGSTICTLPQAHEGKSYRREQRAEACQNQLNLGWKYPVRASENIQDHLLETHGFGLFFDAILPQTFLTQFCPKRGRPVRCARAVRKGGCFPLPVATGPRVLNSAPPMLC